MSSENEIEEERRLFYVAVTRAKKSLELSFANTRMRNGKHESNAPSRFIREIDRQYIANPLSGYGDDLDGGSDGFSGSGFGRASQWSARRNSPESGSRYGSSRPGYAYGRSGASRSETSGRSFTGQRTGTVQSPASGHQGFGQSGPAQRIITPFRKPSAAVPPRVSDKDFEPTPVMQLRAGQRVEHNRFGLGYIKEITGGPADLKAKIAFDDHGEKILLLKYAKIRVVE